jgi:hypothetical protein
MLGTRKAILAVLLMCLVGQAWSGEPRPAGTVFIIGGVGGIDPLQSHAPRVLPAAGVPHRIVVFHWTHGKMHTLKDLQDTPHLLARARELGALVMKTLECEPGRPVYLVGHSAGAALALAAAGELPPASIKRIILLSPSVSPHFNLCPALRATQCEIVSFHSCRDVLWLGLCTTVLGTSDGVHSCGAGKDGFALPPCCEEEACCLYRRLVQCSWRVENILHGVSGGHNGACGCRFLAHEIAPWLMP